MGIKTPDVRTAFVLLLLHTKLYVNNVVGTEKYVKKITYPPSCVAIT